MAVACPLSLLPNAEPAVLPEVPAGASILNVGFAPGREEVELGRPFVGASGRLLRQWLAQAGLLDRSAFINVEGHRTRDLVCRKCRITFGKVLNRVALIFDKVRNGTPLKTTEQRLFTKWERAYDCPHVWQETHANREPTQDEACGLPIIEKLLQGPRQWSIVLCWGAVPARVLGGYKGPVGSMVGRFRTLPQHNNVLCTVLYHPAYALRQRGSPAFAKTEAIVKEILRQVRDRLDNPSPRADYPYFRLGLPRLSVLPSRPVVDIETATKSNVPDPRVDTPRTLCVGSLTSPTVVLSPLSEASRVELPAGAKPIMHNAQYDLPLLYRLGVPYDVTADDTMVMAYLLGHEVLSLKVLGRRLLGRHTREFLEKAGPDDPEYDAQDPHLTKELYVVLRRQIDARGLAFLYDEVKTPLQRIMARHVVQGLRIDQERLAALHAKMSARAAALEAQLKALAGPDFNPRSPGAAADFIYDVLQLPPDRKLGRTTNEKYLGEFRSVPFVSLLLAYRKAQSFISRYTVPLQQLSRVSGLYDLTGTGTDRVSQSRRNCMNFPSLIKQCIQADDGGYFVYGDFSQIELRLAAYFSQDPYLLAVLREGRNMHEELCLAVYGARTPDTYTQAKSANFARLYGAGLTTRARTLKMPVDVVQRTEIAWPGWDAWVERRRREPARTFWGYQRNLDDALDSADEYLREKALRQIVNSIIQGTAGEINQYAQVLGDKYLRQLGGHVVHQEHDSVLGWVPEDIPVDEAKQALATAMAEAVPDDIANSVGVPAKVTAGTHWN